MPPKRYFEQEDVAAQPAVASSSEVTTAAPVATPTDSSTKRTTKSKVNATLFVSRLPYTATSTDLQTTFSEIGPLKRAFVVIDQATKKSKGVGYVTFAIPEDATTALEQLQGKSLDGGSRKIQIAFADQKDPAGAKRPTLKADPDSPSSSKRPRTETAKPARTNGPVQEKDADAVRTVILSGLAGCSPAPDSKQIYKRARKIGDVDNVIYPCTSSPNPNDVAHVIFRTPNHAMIAVEKLHAHIFKGVQVSAILKKRADNAAKIAAHMRPETLAKREKMRQDIEKNSGKGTMPVLLSEIDKSSRLILRNLPFDVNEADLRSIFLPFGPVYEITIPRAKAKEGAAEVDAKAVKAEEAASPVESDQDVSDSDDESVGVDSDDSESEADEDSQDDEDEDRDSDDDDDDDEENESDGVTEDAVAEERSEAISGESDDDADSSEDVDAAAGSADIVVKTENDDDADILSTPTAPATVQSTSSKPAAEKGRGFAFVWMVSRNDAARAIEAVNGKPIQHGAAERAAYKSALGSRGRRFAKAALDRVRANAQPERAVAVDWALSKKDYEAKADESESEEDAEDADGQDAASDDEDDASERPQLPAPEEGTTLFVRNLPYQATEEELRNLFRTFGPLRYAKITMDRSTGRSKGTGFVCFWQASSADAALAQAKIIERESGVSGSTSASVANQKNPFAMPSVLTADPAAPLTASLNLHGRVLNVIPAVARDEASRLENSGRKEREKGDKRNTWLLREGVPFPNSDFAAKLSPSEVEKRLTSFQVRKAQMGANPSLFISKTRLSIRSLPLFVSDRMLKRLAIHAIKTFATEVRSGARADLDADEKADRTLSASAENRKRKPGERPTPVVQSKIVRQHDRIEALTGLGKSKGYGFLEMKSFHDALKVIRWSNGNKAVGKLLVEWWKDDLSQQVDRIATTIHTKTQTLEQMKLGEEKEKLGEEIAELATRRQRLRTKIAELSENADAGSEGKERGGMLMIEFAIENVVTTKKRADKLKAIKESGERRKAREEQEELSKQQQAEERKRELQAARKIQADKNKPKGFAHGAVIGKKRKERKARRG
ncbi:Nucleolar protein 4 [Pseudozyma hubeiensis]|nr:Nucleolar protein 4 [Pseudozyma hubeiensis]